LNEVTVSAQKWFFHLARNNAWANERLYRACGELTHDELTLRRTSFFPTILGTLAHIVVVDMYYVDGLERAGRGRKVFDEEASLDRFDRVRAAQRAVDARLLALLSQSGDAWLDEDVGLERRHGIEVDRAGDILMHLFEHQIHHRGQVHAMLSGTRVKPPQLDEYFLASDRRLADRELDEAGMPLPSTGDRRV
jgi:uncharacterized damage-inducible protein DinB